MSLASIAEIKGHDVQVWDAADPDFRDEEAFISSLRDARPDLVGLSCISGFSYPSLLTVAGTIKRLLPESIVVAGGMDHVGRIPQVVLEEAPGVDAVVSGYGEEPFVEILEGGARDLATAQIPGVNVRGRLAEGANLKVPTAMPTLDHRLYRGFRSLPPSVELARGCPFQCSFCVSAGSALIRRTPADLAEQMLQACVAYENPDSQIYVEAPLATFDKEYLRLLRMELVARGIRPTWRAECRVDALNPGLADQLAESGCRVLDLGLESASPLILGWMRKGAHPERYLRRGSDLLESLAGAGIFAKVNVLFYAGENQETLKTTYEFLDKRRSHIGAIAAGPLYLYPGIAGEAIILQLIHEQGGEVVQTAEWQSMHINPVNPSRHLGFEELLEVSLAWEREFQSAYDYWYHRRWGYFSPNVTYAEFAAAVAEVGVEHFPFSSETFTDSTENSREDMWRDK